MTAIRHLASRVLQSRLLPVALVVAVLVVGALLLRGPQLHEVTAYFTDSSGLVAGNEVRQSGIVVGDVASVEAWVDRDRGTQLARVTLRVDDAHWPLRQGTTWAVRPKGVLSNVYVSLQPGSPQAPALAAAHEFGASETSSPVHLDQFSDIFDRSVRESIRTQLQDGVLALGGSGADNLNGLLAGANPLTRDLAPLTAVLAQRSPELDRLNGEVDTITADLAREDAALRSGIAHSDSLLASIAAKDVQLQGTLDHAAGTLASIDGGLRGEEPNLRAILTKGPAALDRAKAFADTLTPLVVNLNPHVQSLDTLLNEFITATGYPAGGVDTLRVDGSLPPPGYGVKPCGGTPENRC